MKICDLPMSECCIDQSLSVGEMAKLFEQHQDWHGVILTNKKVFVGAISRHRCFEMLGKPYGIEIFAKMTVGDFFRTYTGSHLLLQADVSIQEAVKMALNRHSDVIYDPIAVEIHPTHYALVNMQALLIAQYELLEHVYSEVQALSIKDPLTNLWNRRGFFEEVSLLLDTQENNFGNLAAFMIDIDHFKITNDIYGHFVGDQVIRVVAEECQKLLRPIDLLSRFGGEEFIAILPDTSVDTACKIAELIRGKIEKTVFHVKGYHVSITVSIGVSHIKDARGSLDNLLSQADRAMYAAKTAGRNQVSKWDPQIACRMRKDSIVRDVDAHSENNWKPGVRSDISKIYDETIEGWAKALELRDKETEGHAQRVVNMTIALARKCGVAEKDMEDIRRGALLHDIGKIAILDPILFKPAPLSEDEWVVMRKHPVYAYEFLSPITFLQNSLDIPYCHHEHWDGNGYPRKLKGQEIPIAARIFTIVDVWDALLTDRSYRNAWSPELVREYIVKQSGIIFDPAITACFLEMLDETANS